MYWTLYEYIFHRYLLHSENHWMPSHPLGYALQYLLHGIHHSFPHDKFHLVFPIVPGFIILNIILVPINIYAPEEVRGFISSGFLLGYLWYDMVHYWFHASSPSSGYLKYLKHHHMLHHYRNGQQSFGISSTFWDHVFFTKKEY